MSKGRIYTQSLTVPNTASTVTNGSAFEIPVPYTAMTVVAELASHTGGTLDVYLQDSFDGGTTWYDCVHVAQLGAATTATKRFALTLDSTQRAIDKGNKSAPAAGLAADAAVSAPWGRKLRIVAITGAGTSGASKVQTFTFFPVVLEP